MYQQLTRSLINRSIEIAIKVCQSHNITLPKWAYWTKAEFDKHITENNLDISEIRDCRLGWDVTDFGSNNFNKIGRVLFTVRNGKYGDTGYKKSYCEKIIINREFQTAPKHYHISKREDIINRSKNTKYENLLNVQLWKNNENGQLNLTNTLSIQVDGITKNIISGDTIQLQPGESLCIPPGVIHQFWGDQSGSTLIDGVRYNVSGEVSSVCNDLNDNFFLDKTLTRFPTIIEDEPAKYYLCNEY